MIERKELNENEKGSKTESSFSEKSGIDYMDDFFKSQEDKDRADVLKKRADAKEKELKEILGS